MTTQLNDGSFTGIKKFEEAYKEFNDLQGCGLAKAFYVGSEQELEEVKTQADFQTQLDELKEEFRNAQPVKTFLHVPTLQEIKDLTEK